LNRKETMEKVRLKKVDADGWKPEINTKNTNTD